MKQENKERLKAASAEADTLTDNVLLKVSQSPYSWLILAVSHGIAFCIGAWLL